MIKGGLLYAQEEVWRLYLHLLCAQSQSEPLKSTQLAVQLHCNAAPLNLLLTRQLMPTRHSSIRYNRGLWDQHSLFFLAVPCALVLIFFFQTIVFILFEKKKHHFVNKFSWRKKFFIWDIPTYQFFVKNSYLISNFKSKMTYNAASYHSNHEN